MKDYKTYEIFCLKTNKINYLIYNAIYFSVIIVDDASFKIGFVSVDDLTSKILFNIYDKANIDVNSINDYEIKEDSATITLKNNVTLLRSGILHEIKTKYYKKESCECGANHTSNPSYHLRFLSGKQ